MTAGLWGLGTVPIGALRARALADVTIDGAFKRVTGTSRHENQLK